jgi:hypothetical protein
MMLYRRSLLAAAFRAPLSAPRAATPAAPAGDALAARLREGGVVIALRHALAPGTFDPPGFRLGECGTQRNLSDEGRTQARRIGRWFAERGLVPARVRSSPWCRCIDTATLAFGRAEPWAALGSPRGTAEATRATQRGALRTALAALARRRNRGRPSSPFEAWVTHQFVLRDLTGQSTDSGEALLLASDAGGAVRLLDRAVLH